MLAPDNYIVKEYFRKMIGEEGLRIIMNLPEGEITDEEIARLSDTKLTQVRKILYTLYENRIAEYRTERDDNSGWVTYLWRFDYSNVRRLMEAEADKKLIELRKRLDREKRGVFYQCKCQRVLFEEAAAMDFRCDECGSEFEYVDNGDQISELEAEIEKIERWKEQIRNS